MSVRPPDHHTPGQPMTLTHPVVTPWLRWIYLGLALLFLLLGVIGLFLPILPTTPFILLAAWAAARSSPRLLHWLQEHTVFGPMIRDWRQGGVVRRRAKWAATSVMAVSASYLLWAVRPLWAPLTAIACMAAVLVWLWRRPERHADEAASEERPNGSGR